MNHTISLISTKVEKWIRLQMQANNNLIRIKVPILGDSNVGKSTLFHLFRGLTEKRFSYKTNDFILIENVKYQNYMFNIKFCYNFCANNIKKIQKDIFLESNVAIVMYDVSDTSRKSYIDMRNWINELWKNNEENRMPVLIIGNKIDLRRANIPTLELKECTDISQNISKECNINIPQIEISALAHENCEQIINIVLDLAIKQNIKRTKAF